MVHPPQQRNNTDFAAGLTHGDEHNQETRCGRSVWFGFCLGEREEGSSQPPNTTQVTAWAQPQPTEPHNKISSNLTPQHFLKNSTPDQEGIPSFEGLWVSVMGVFGWFWYFSQAFKDAKGCL